MDPYPRNPMLSPESPRDVKDEIPRPPVDTPARRSLLQRVLRRGRARRDREGIEVPWFLDGMTVPSPEGSAEVLDEIEHGTPLTPERAATFERMRAMAGVRRRKFTRSPRPQA